MTIHLPLLVVLVSEGRHAFEETSMKGGEHMDQIIERIFEEMRNDDADDSRQLLAYYNSASTEQRTSMNDMCIFLCGYSLETIFERCGLTVDASTGQVGV